MKRQNMIEALCYENYILKTRYNELIIYIAKLETDITNLKQINSTENLVHTNEKSNNECMQEQTDVSILRNGPIILVDEPTITSAPIFQISRYCSSINNNTQTVDKSDNISELTYE